MQHCCKFSTTVYETFYCIKKQVSNGFKVTQNIKFLSCVFIHSIHFSGLTGAHYCIKYILVFLLVTVIKGNKKLRYIMQSALPYTHAIST